MSGCQLVPLQLYAHFSTCVFYRRTTLNAEVVHQLTQYVLMLTRFAMHVLFM